jgi:hypothetical protein
MLLVGLTPERAGVLESEARLNGIWVESVPDVQTARGFLSAVRVDEVIVARAADAKELESVLPKGLVPHVDWRWTPRFVLGSVLPTANR